MSKVATSINMEVILVTAGGNLTLNKGTCTIIYIPLIMPQTYDKAPFMTTLIMALAAVAACKADLLPVAVKPS